jgi:hypothetical protein
MEWLDSGILLTFLNCRSSPTRTVVGLTAWALWAGIPMMMIESIIKIIFFITHLMV